MSIQPHAMNATTGHRGRGSTLIVGMFLLLLMSVVSLTVLKAIKTDERMAGNLQDRNLAFQAAESALREAEELLAQTPLPGFDGSNGLYSVDDAQVPAAFDLTSDNARTYGHDLIGIALRPRYIIEMMEAGVEPGNSLVDRSARRATFRITALGFGGSATTRVVLQSTYRP
jgi:type IV pilus assembly protein PilX